MKIIDKIHEAIQIDDDGLTAQQILQRFGWQWFWAGVIVSTIIFSLILLTKIK